MGVNILWRKLYVLIKRRLKLKNISKSTCHVSASYSFSFRLACHPLLLSRKYRQNYSLCGIPWEVIFLFSWMLGDMNIECFIKFTSLLVVIIDEDIKNVILRRYNSANGTETYKIDYMGWLAFNEVQLNWISCNNISL